MRPEFFLCLTVLCGTATAGTLYNINFPPVGAGPQPSGSFTYDPVTGFSNFMVSWAGYTFDLTSSANAPTLGTPNPCTGRASTASYGFFMMQQLTTGCGTPTSYEWNGNDTGVSATFEFLQFPPGGGFSGDAIINTHSVPPNFGVGNQGSFSIMAQPAATPEPSSMALLVCGLGALLALGLAGKARRLRAR